jgi:8-oxo-dGTP diphosphatase
MTFESRPFVGICSLVIKEGKLLLGKRKGAHGEGEWALPGGPLEPLESCQQNGPRRRPTNRNER